MTQAQVLALIQQWIVANGNNEITANVLRPILEAMLNQPNSLIGDLDDLQTGDQSNLVAAINEIISQELTQINLTLLSQHTESQTTGDTGTNLLQPDFGAAIFTVADMQEGSSYSGEIMFRIENNDTGTAKSIVLFGVELININTAIPVISGLLKFDIDFYDQAGDDIDCQISFSIISSGLIDFDTKTETIDNTLSYNIAFSVGGDATDNIFVKHAKIERNNLKGIL